MLDLNFLRFFSTFNMASHLFLSDIVSDEKLDVTLTGVSSCVVSFFSLSVFKIFSLPFNISTTVMCVGKDLFVFIPLGVH